MCTLELVWVQARTQCSNVSDEKYEAKNEGKSKSNRQVRQEQARGRGRPDRVKCIYFKVRCLMGKELKSKHGL